MKFDWDPVKADANFRKHGLEFPDAAAVIDDAQHLIEDVTRPEFGERRTKAIGRVGMLIVGVIYTDRNDVRRIISARRASRSERERYRQSAESA